MSSEKPRLGDYYATQDVVTFWRKLLFSGQYNDDVVRLASVVFLKDCGAPPRQGWCDTQLSVLLADAFAFGALKYGEVGGWRRDPVDTHLQAAGRHFDAWLKDPTSMDAESALTHEAHFLARAVMILELRRTGR